MGSNPSDSEPLVLDEVLEIISDWEMLNFFPASDNGRLAIAKLVCSLACSVDQVRWLVDRVTMLYNNWPGPAEVRAVYCKRWPPRDGKDVRNSHTSAYFPDGNIPCETPESPAFPAGPLLPAGRKDLLLPAGHAVSADVEVENSIRRASSEVVMNPKRRGESAAALVPVKNHRRVTAAELERAAAEVSKARSAPHEFEDSGAGGLCRVCWLRHDAGDSLGEKIAYV